MYQQSDSALWNEKALLWFCTTYHHASHAGDAITQEEVMGATSNEAVCVEIQDHSDLGREVA